MKHFAILIAFAIAAVLAPAAFAGGFYIGVGATSMKEADVPVTTDDQFVVAMSDAVPSTRTEDGRHNGLQFILGWGSSSGIWALELGYMGGDSGSSATTRGESLWLPGNNVIITANQVNKVEATSLSALGKLPMGERFNLFGRVGAMKVKKTSTFSGEIVESTGAQIFSFELKEKESKSSALFGVGMSAKLLGELSLRAEVQKASALPGTMASVALVYGF